MTATVRLKHLCDHWGEYGLGISAEQYAPEGIRLIRTSDITDDGKLIPAEDGVFVDPAVVDGLRLRTGDLLISRSGTVGRSFLFDEQEHGTCTFAAYLVRFRLKTVFDPQFVYYFTKSAPFEQQIQLDATQATIANFNAQKLGNLQLPALPPAQQKAIANFLDRETDRIDRALATLRRTRQLLEKKLDGERDRILAPGLATPEGQARPPAGWRLSPLMRLTDPMRPIVYGIVQAGPEIPDGVPYIKTGDVADLDPERLSRTSDVIDAMYRRARVRPGDIVIAMRASVGLPVIVPTSLPTANLTQGTARVAPAPGVVSRWLYQALRTTFVQVQCRNRAVGTTYLTLNIWDLRRVLVPTPPQGEQRTLALEVEHLEEQTERAVRLRQRQEDLLLERRQALITAAVTGQVEVAGTAA